MYYESEVLIHYGTKRHSGRFPWGSGDNPYQHDGGFNGFVKELQQQGMTMKEISEVLDIPISEIRERKAIEKEEKRARDISVAVRMKEHGYSNVEIGKKLGCGESQVRNLLKPHDEDKENKIHKTADILQKNVDEKGYIDVGAGVEIEMGISKETLNGALTILSDKGYPTHNVQVDQLGVAGNKTTVEVVCPPGTTYVDVKKNMDNVHTITEYSTDYGRTYLGLETPKSVSSKRIQINYAEDGGVEKDGVIELRRGVPDISLGQAQYAQVRIAVDDTHYLKGMAIYSDDLPPGVDIRFNTNKHKGTPMIGPKDNSVLKPMQTDENGNIDKDNPFGSYIKLDEHGIPKQLHYTDKNGKDQLGCINIVNEEGDWGEWRKTLASQMLSKQSPTLAKNQLDISYNRAKSEYDEIMSLTNPVLKKKLLESFADNCDSATVHLKAAALPRQASQVILPIPSMRDDEIYAPNFRHGEKVALIRYPHAGTFEIPILTVNKNQKEAKAVLGQAADAVGINKKVADRMSGADFDGDTVLVIPINDKVKIKSSSPLKGLVDFDPKEQYPGYPGMPEMKDGTKQNEMGKISNLITDMTLKGAPPEDLERAVKHSMVVIDAQKHKLNYKLSYDENGIEALKKEYQNGGASATLISRAKSPERVPERKARYRVDPNTGEKIFTQTNRSYINKKGKLVEAQTKSNKMTEAFINGKDAYSLSSGTTMENIYAHYANEMKALANQSRKEAYAVNDNIYSKSAAKLYSNEVDSLKDKLRIAKLNAPKERQAQILANTIVAAKKRDNPSLSEDKDRLKKVKAQALNASRVRVGAKKQQIQITDREWEAIQSGAVNKTTLNDILNNTELDALKQRAMPRNKPAVSQAKINTAKSMARAGYTQAEIAKELGISTTTVSKAIRGQL